MTTKEQNVINRAISIGYNYDPQNEDAYIEAENLIIEKVGIESYERADSMSFGYCQNVSYGDYVCSGEIVSSDMRYRTYFKLIDKKTIEVVPWYNLPDTEEEMSEQGIFLDLNTIICDDDAKVVSLYW